jgi:CRISPR-associated protein Cas1
MPIIQNLIVEEFGAFVSKHSERLIVSKGDEKLIQAPLLHLETVLIASRGVAISSDAVRECAERGIPIHFVSGSGNAYASMYSSGLTGTVLTRRAQLAAFHTLRGLFLPIAFAQGKLSNQANFLKYMSKYRKESAPEIFEILRAAAEKILETVNDLETLKTLPEVLSGERATIDDWRFELLGMEGRAAQTYWEALKRALPQELEWQGREGRGARDPINAALNYCYGILYGQIERALVLAGLDPYAGFAHVDRPGKPSLTFDAIEEFRAPIVDRTIFGLANKGVKFEQDERGYLTEGTRKMLAEKFFERMEATESYAVGDTAAKKSFPLRLIAQMQARHVATFLRGEREEYAPFVMGW